jgi:class 3 adenylate cyclase
VAKPGMIVIGENTFDAVKDLFDVKSLGKATLKGKQKEVAVYAVEKAKEGAGFHTPTPTSPQTNPSSKGAAIRGA